MIRDYLEYYPKLMRWTEPWPELQALLSRLGMPVKILERSGKDNRHIMMFSLRKPPHHVIFGVTAWPNGSMRFSKGEFDDRYSDSTRTKISSAAELEYKFRYLKRQGYYKTPVHPRVLERIRDF